MSSFFVYFKKILDKLNPRVNSGVKLLGFSIFAKILPVQLKMRIFGKVQGVWYRASTAGVARDLKLRGHAKNLPDDSVEVVAVGSEKNLLKLKKWCAQGPTRSMVERIEEEWSENEGSFEDFKVL